MDTHPTDIILWKLYKPRPFDEIYNPDFLKNVQLLHRESQVTNKNENESAVQLMPGARLGTSWPNGAIHVLVQVPGASRIPVFYYVPLMFCIVEPRVAKRKADELDVDELEQRKRNPLATAAPSTIATASNYKQLQLGPDAILDDIPTPNLYIPPINLLYDGFGHFLDICKQDNPEPQGINSFKLTSAVDKFADAMTQFCPNEDMRRDTGLTLLNEIFAAREDPIPNIDIRPSSIGSARTDGHCIGPHGLTPIISEFKNLECDFSTLPVAQALSYFAHSQKAAIESAKDPKRFVGWRIPCIGIVVIGQS